MDNKGFPQGNLIERLDANITDATDVKNVRAVIASEKPDGTYENIAADQNGRLKVLNGTTDIFGSALSIELSPVSQNYAPYGIIHDQLFEQFTASGGTITPNANGTEIDFNITTTVGSYSTLRSRRVAKYRPGQGIQMRTSAVFDTPVANSLQFVGLGNANSDLYFCYSGTDFGVRRSTGGLGEVRTLTMTAASATAQTATITLNGVAFTASLSNAGGDIAFTAHEIEVGDTYTGWNVDHIGNTLVFQASSVGPRNGTYSFSVDGGTAAGTFSQNKAGAALTTEFVPLSSCNGNSIMKTTTDPTQHNLYQIFYSWFGGANIVFQIYNPASGEFETVHTMNFANTQADPSLTAPNMYAQQGLASLGSTTAMTMKSTCTYVAQQGIISFRDPVYSAAAEVDVKEEKNIIVLKNRHVINGFANNSEIYLKRITLACESTKSTLIKIIRNPTSIGADTTSDYSNLQEVDSQSLMLRESSSLTYTGGDILNQFYIPKDGGIDLSFGLELEMARDDVILISGTSAASSIVSLSVSWVEDL